MQDFTELKVWQWAFALTIEIHEALEHAPRTHGFAVMDQLRRAIVSVGANIAEGSRKQTRRDYARFLNIAQGSLAETEHLLRVAKGIRLIDDEVAASFLRKVEPLARGLSRLRDRVLRDRSSAAPNALPAPPH